MRIGTTFSQRDELLLRRLVAYADVIETTPDSITVMRGGRPELDDVAVDVLRSASKYAQIVVHGVGLSIAAADGWNDDYLRLLDQLFERVSIAHHSEHLGYAPAGRGFLGTILPPPRVEAAVELISRRAAALRSRYGVPFLLENVVSLVPERQEPDYTPAAFLNEIARRSGCGVLLDVYGLAFDAQNGRIDLDDFLAELDLGRVRELHVANGVGRRTRRSTLDLAQWIAARARNADLIVYEQEATAVVDEVRLLRERFAA